MRGGEELSKRPSFITPTYSTTSIVYSCRLVGRSLGYKEISARDKEEVYLFTCVVYSYCLVGRSSGYKEISVIFKITLNNLSRKYDNDSFLLLISGW